MSSQNKNVGFIIAAIGGAVGLLAFFAMSFFAYSIISFSGQQLASLGQQISQFSSSSSNAQALVVLWLAPIVAGIIILVALLQFRSTVQLSAKRAAAGWLIALSIIGIVLYVGILIYLNSLISSFNSNAPSLLSFIGAGYWAYLISMIGVIVGASMVLSGKAQAISAPISSSYPPYQQPPTPTQYPPQYPPYQQPWSQQPQYPTDPQAPDSLQWPPSQPNG